MRIVLTLLLSVSSITTTIAQDLGSSDSIEFLQPISMIQYNHLELSKQDFNKGFFTHPMDLIIGKTPGVLINSESGAPGYQHIIHTLGIGSFDQSQTPLLVIDDIPYYNTPLNIHPSDIESISFTYDLSETYKYATNSNTGIIKISTINKQSRPLRTTYVGRVAMKVLPNKIDVLSADEFRSYYMSKFGPEDHDNLGQANTDWQDLMFRKVVATDHYISLSGNLIDNKLPVDLSFSNTYNPGILKSTSQERENLKAYLRPDLFAGSLKIGILYHGQIENLSLDSDRELMNRIIYFDPTAPVYNDDGSYNSVDRVWVNPLEYIETYNEILESQYHSYAIHSNYTAPFLEGLSIKSTLNKRITNYSYIKNKPFDNSFNQQEGVTRFLDTELSYLSDQTKELQYQLSIGSSYNTNTHKGRNIGTLRQSLYSNYLRFIINNNHMYSFGGSLRYDRDTFRQDTQGLLSWSANYTWNIKNDPYYINNKNVTDILLKICLNSIQTSHFGYTWLDDDAKTNFQMNDIKENQFSMISKLDLGWLKGKYVASIQYFVRNLKNARWDQGLGHVNDGSVRSSGVSLNFKFKENITPNMYIGLYSNLTYSRNKIHKLNDWHHAAQIFGTELTVNRKHEKVNAFDLKPQVYDKEGVPLENKYDHLNQDFNRTAYPKVVLGIGNELNYKKLGFRWSGRLSGGSHAYDQLTAVRSTDIKFDVNFNTTQSAIEHNFERPRLESDIHLYANSFFRLDYASFIYELISSDRIHIEADLTFQNTFTITNYPGQDPEIPSGIDQGQYPRARITSFGMKVTF